MKERQAYFDFLRGCAIVVVVAIHTFKFAEDSIAIRQLFNAAVPIFIAISGYFLSQKKIESKVDYCSFLSRQLPKVYLPVLLWSLPLYVLSLISGSIFFIQTGMLFCCGFSVYYFVAFIMQCYIVLPVITNCILGSYYRGGSGYLPCFFSMGVGGSIREYR